ncbi:MAG: L-histidine N(alpha)-methyltransferase [Myxococcota bacterium]
MPRAQRSPRYEWIEGEVTEAQDSFASAVADGLGKEPRTLPCRFLYDELGSELFEEICELPEYYLTRAEHEILEQHADAIVAACPTPSTLAELGSGSSTKTRLLIEAFLRRQGRLRYVPVDISRTMLDDSAKALLADYGALEILAIAGEYREGLHHVGRETRQPKLIAWLGSNIGNFTREQALQFVSGMRAQMSEDDRLLLGIDLRKDTATLEDAYDDPQGVTARFNKNLLTRINRELGGDFELDAWRHRARVIDNGGRVELGLLCERSSEVRIEALDRGYRFEAGDFIHTEDSTKYSEGEVVDLAGRAGLVLSERWLDTKGRYSLNLLSLA